MCRAIVAGESPTCLSRDDIIRDDIPMFGPPHMKSLTLSPLFLSPSLSDTNDDSNGDDENIRNDNKHSPSRARVSPASSADDVITLAPSNNVIRRRSSASHAGRAYVIVNNAVCASLTNGFGDNNDVVVTSPKRALVPKARNSIVSDALPRVCSFDTVKNSFVHKRASVDNNAGGGVGLAGGRWGELRGRLVTHGGSEGHCLATLKKAGNENGQGHAKSLSSACLLFKETAV